MSAADMIERKQEEYEDAKGNHTRPASMLVRDFRASLEQVAAQLDKDEHRTALLISKLKQELKVLRELAADRIIGVEEARQIRVVSNDRNLVKHPQYEEWEPY